MKYRKKPIVIEAIQWTGGNPEEIYDFTGKHLTVGMNTDFKLTLEIDTLEGTMIATEGDFIIRGVNGELYPCKPDIFEKTYEGVE